MAVRENGVSEYTEDGSVDLKGNPVLRSKRGGWTACSFIVGNNIYIYMYSTLFFFFFFQKNHRHIYSFHLTSNTNLYLIY